MGESSSLRREIASAYLASGAKIVSWVVVAGVVYRVGGAVEFGILSLIRGTIGILSYVSLGVGPAMVRMMAGAQAQAVKPLEMDQGTPPTLSYYGPESRWTLAWLYSNAVSFAAISAVVGMTLLIIYHRSFTRLHHVPGDLAGEAKLTAFWMGMGLLTRLVSDAPAAVLQTNQRISKDNYLVLEAELVWVVFTGGLMLSHVLHSGVLVHAGLGYLVASFVLLLRRTSSAQAIVGRPKWILDPVVMKKIAALGGLVTLAQLADFLYAPTDYILINRFLDTATVSVYAPAVQIDAGLLVLVSGLAAVLFPRSAIAHARGDVAEVRKYYLRGTAWSAGILIVAGGLMWLASPIFLRAWFGNSMPATRAILPLVLIHTVIGGSAMVGRSVLLAAGRFGAFAGSVLIAGVVNVVVSYALVKAGWGLRGIIIGTIVAVVLRCVVWMPWFVMRSLREVKEIAVAPIAVPEV